MKIDILTLFPDMFTGPFEESMVWKAKEKGLVDIEIHNLRNWGEGDRKVVDDRPYGGGVGMLLRVDIIDEALKNLRKENSKVILMDAGGEKFSQAKARELSKEGHIILIAGHYEGVDYRVIEHLVDEVISIGDFVLTGGEIPAMAVTDAIVRLIPGVLEKEGASEIESFTENLIEFPQYTRPDDYKGWKVPEILKSGDHKKISDWRQQKSVERTKEKRPDLV